MDAGELCCPSHISIDLHDDGSVLIEDFKVDQSGEDILCREEDIRVDWVDFCRSIRGHEATGEMPFFGENFCVAQERRIDVAANGERRRVRHRSDQKIRRRRKDQKRAGTFAMRGSLCVESGVLA